MLCCISLVLSFAAASPERVTVFDASRLETPEGLALDLFGNAYVTLALTGEIRRISPDGTHTSIAFLPIGAPPLTPCPPEAGFVGIIGNLDIDLFGNLYVGAHSCASDETGVYRVSRRGVVTKLAALPAPSQPNGVEQKGAYLYVTDSYWGRVWRIPVGGGEATIWSDDALLKARLVPIFPASNGLQFFRGAFYVSVPDTEIIVRIALRADGTAGPAVIYAHAGCDDFAFDIIGNLYCGTDPFNTVLRVFPDGGVETLLDITDGLDGPTAVQFGRSLHDLGDIYITNAAFPFFPNNASPSLMRYHIGIPGALNR